MVAVKSFSDALFRVRVMFGHAQADKFTFFTRAFSLRGATGCGTTQDDHFVEFKGTEATPSTAMGDLRALAKQMSLPVTPEFDSWRVELELTESVKDEAVRNRLSEKLVQLPGMERVRWVELGWDVVILRLSKSPTSRFQQQVVNAFSE